MGSLGTDATESPADILTAQQMRAYEAARFASGAITSAEAMDRAGQAVVDHIVDLVPTSGTALVLCGPGNNGGDGYVVARALHGLGWHVHVAGLRTASAMPQDARQARMAWEAMGEVWNLSAFSSAPLARAARPDVLVDAVFGIGLSRAVSDPLADQFATLESIAQGNRTLRIAVDVPSGVDTDTGQVLGRALAADHTVTFHRRKPVHTLAPDLCGAVHVADIGL